MKVSLLYNNNKTHKICVCDDVNVYSSIVDAEDTIEVAPEYHTEGTYVQLAR